MRLSALFASLLLVLACGLRADDEEMSNERRLLMFEIDNKYVDAMLEYENARAEFEWREEQFARDDKRRYERKMENAKEDMTEAKKEIQEAQKDATKEYVRLLEREDEKLRRMDERLARATENQRERYEPKMQEMRLKLDFYQQVVDNVGLLDKFSHWQDRNGKPLLRPAPSNSARKWQYKELPAFQVELFGQDEPYDSSKREGVLVLAFWTVLNDGSVDLLRELDRTQSKYRGKPVQWLAVNLDDPPDELRQTLGRTRYDILLGKDSPGEEDQRKKKLSEIFEVRFAPTVFVTDTKGVVQHVLVGHSNRHSNYLDDMIERQLEQAEERQEAAQEEE